MTLLNRWLASSPSVLTNYQKFVQKIVEPLFTKLRVDVIENEPKLDRYARQIAINLACQAGHSACLDQVEAKIQAVVAGTTTIAPDLQSAIYCNGLRTANQATYDFFIQKMLASEDQAERTLIIAALGCSTSSERLNSLLGMALEANTVRLQEKFRILTAPLNSGDVALRTLIDFIRANYVAINTIADNQARSMVANLAPRITLFTQADFTRLLTFLQTNGVLTETQVASYSASVTSNVLWMTRNADEIGNWLVLDDTTTTPTGEPTTPGASTTALPTTTAGADSFMISTFVLATCAVIKYFL